MLSRYPGQWLRVKVAIVHDYLTQRGGAERVVLAMLRAFPDAPLYTSLYDPEETFPGFREAVVHTSVLNRLGILRRSHRLALPLLASTFSRFSINADVAVCSSSGWAHGARVSGRKVVYCYAPARWLYQGHRYVAPRSPIRYVLAAMRPGLVRWDRRAARTADKYLVMTQTIAEQVRELYGIEAEVLPPPHSADPAGQREHPKQPLEPGFFVCVARLLPYKNVAAVVEAFENLPDERLVVVGDGPEAARLRALAPANVAFVPRVTDSQLRWLYEACAGTLSASYEDFGLVPLEAAAFGRPTAALRFGGSLDTICEGRTGVLFDEPTPADVATAVRGLAAGKWDPDVLRAHASRFSEASFATRLREVVQEVGALST